jgi:putative glycosyltransferase (TIGR04372 family)
MHPFPKKVIKAILIALGFLPALLLRFLNIRFLPAMIDRIGHLALEPDCYLKEEKLGLHPGFKIILCAPRSKVANQAMAEYWGRHFFLISSPWLCYALKPFSLQKILRYEVDRYVVAIGKTADFFLIQKQWSGNPPILSLTQEHVSRGECRLRELGVPPEAWFVCVHNREGKYSPHDEHLHSFRNGHIETYFMAMRAITDQGGWCIRMGDPTMKNIVPMKNVIDYAHHPLKEDWMDLFLAARCRFFLGCGSGAYAMASVFGVPVATVNQAPLSAVLPFGKNDLGIPKLLWSRNDQRMLNFSEIFSSSLSNMRYAEEYDQAQVDLVDSTQEDILALAEEMLERTENRAVYTTTDNDLQLRFKALMRPGHYSYGSESRVGRSFIRKYEHLLC